MPSALPSLNTILNPDPAPDHALTRYATPQAYVNKFGLAEAVQMLGDEQRRLTDVLLLAALVEVNGGSSWPDNTAGEDRQAALAAVARLERQLTISSRFMDGYLRAKLVLPVLASDANASTLEDCCLALARCGLADDSDNATERMDACCKDWRAWLKDVAAGKAQLVAATGESLAPTTAAVRTGTTKSTYDWGRFGGLR